MHATLVQFFKGGTVMADLFVTVSRSAEIQSLTQILKVLSWSMVNACVQPSTHCCWLLDFVLLQKKPMIFPHENCDRVKSLVSGFCQEWRQDIPRNQSMDEWMNGWWLQRNEGWFCVCPECAVNQPLSSYHQSAVNAWKIVSFQMRLHCLRMKSTLSHASSGNLKVMRMHTQFSPSNVVSWHEFSNWSVSLHVQQWCNSHWA